MSSLTFRAAVLDNSNLKILPSSHSRSAPYDQARLMITSSDFKSDRPSQFSSCIDNVLVRCEKWIENTPNHCDEWSSMRHLARDIIAIAHKGRAAGATHIIAC